MSIQPDTYLTPFWQPLSVPCNEDATLSLTVTQPESNLPYDLTNCTVTVVIKGSRYADDSTGSTFVCTITDAVGGLATVTIPAASLLTTGSLWYRAEISAGLNRVSPYFGPFTVYAV